MADNKWLLQRGEPSRLAAILVHVTVIRATTGTPRPFNDFYPLANVLYVRTCEISPACMYLCKDVPMCEYISPAYSGVQSSSVVQAKSPLVQPLLNSSSMIILENAFRGWNPLIFCHSLKEVWNAFAAFVTRWIIHSRSIQCDLTRLVFSQSDRFNVLRSKVSCKYLSILNPNESTEHRNRYDFGLIQISMLYTRTKIHVRYIFPYVCM